MKNLKILNSMKPRVKYSVSAINGLVGLSETAIRSTLKEMVERGYLKTEIRKFKSGKPKAVYFLPVIKKGQILERDIERAKKIIFSDRNDLRLKLGTSNFVTLKSIAIGVHPFPDSLIPLNRLLDAAEIALK